MSQKFPGRKPQHGSILVGVCEDRFDPLEAGRFRIRWFGWHTNPKNEIPTENLPWAYALIPLDKAHWCSTSITEGTYVTGYFLDGPTGSFPIITGVLNGIPEKEAISDEPFYDPRPDSILEGHQVPREPDKLTQHDDGSGNDIDEQAKKSRFPDKKYLKEPHIPREARGVEDGTCIEKKRKNIDIGQKDIPTANHPAGTGTDVDSPGGDWTEKETAYAAKYPYNQVYKSEAGHVFEIDNTPNAERLHWYHRVGTFREIGPVGELVEKIVDSFYQIILEHHYEHVEASKQEVIDWFQKTYINKDGLAGFNYDLTVGPNGDINLTTEAGKLNIHVQGNDHNLKVEGDWNVEIDKSANIIIHENANVVIEGDANVDVKGDYKTNVGGNYDLNVDGNINITSGQTTSIFANQLDHTIATVINTIAGIGIRQAAPDHISDTSGAIYHNCAINNSTAILLGITVDDDGDITPPGSAGPVPDGMSIGSIGIGGIGINDSFDISQVPSEFTSIVDTSEISNFVSDAESNISDTVSDIQSNLSDIANYMSDIADAVTDSQADSIAASEAAIAENPNSPSYNSGSGSGGLKLPGNPLEGVPPGFLWKPVSESNGNLVVLLPKGNKSSVYILDENGSKIEQGREASLANGGRWHYRFNRPGGSFPVNCQCKFDKYQVTIPDPSKRWEGVG